MAGGAGAHMPPQKSKVNFESCRATRPEARARALQVSDICLLPMCRRDAGAFVKKILWLLLLLRLVSSR